LTTEVKYIHIKNPKCPWEGNWTRARVEKASGKVDQQWDCDETNVIRHTFDGRVLDIANWKFEAGTEVNPVTNHFGGKGQSFKIQHHEL